MSRSRRSSALANPNCDLALRYAGDIAGLLQRAAQSAQAAEAQIANGAHGDGLELLVEEIAPLQEALTLIRVVVADALTGGRA